jgi:hypothetical protein
MALAESASRNLNIRLPVDGVNEILRLEQSELDEILIYFGYK